MIDPRAQRTLVKSPPELWAEISDVSALARHLGEFGEIQITRLEPETTVAWEGETARGTVELEASGWGTKVTLTAELIATEPPKAVVVEPVVVEPEPEPVVEPVAVAEPAPVAAAEPEPVAAKPEPPAPTVVAYSPPAAKQGFFARLFGKKAATAAPEPVVVAKPVVVAEPEPVVVAEPEPVAAEPEPVVVAELVAVAEATDQLAPDEPNAEPGELRVGEPVERTLDHDSAVAVLTNVLDDLGSAHHRPFSR